MGTKAVQLHWIIILLVYRIVMDQGWQYWPLTDNYDAWSTVAALWCAKTGVIVAIRGSLMSRLVVGLCFCIFVGDILVMASLFGIMVGVCGVLYIFQQFDGAYWSDWVTGWLLAFLPLAAYIGSTFKVVSGFNPPIEYGILDTNPAFTKFLEKAVAYIHFVGFPLILACVICERRCSQTKGKATVFLWPSSSDLRAGVTHGHIAMLVETSGHPNAYLSWYPNRCKTYEEDFSRQRRGTVTHSIDFHLNFPAMREWIRQYIDNEQPTWHIAKWNCSDAVHACFQAGGGIRWFEFWRLPLFTGDVLSPRAVFNIVRFTNSWPNVVASVLFSAFFIVVFLSFIALTIASAWFHSTTIRCQAGFPVALPFGYTQAIGEAVMRKHCLPVSFNRIGENVCSPLMKPLTIALSRAQCFDF